MESFLVPFLTLRILHSAEHLAFSLDTAGDLHSCANVIKIPEVSAHIPNSCFSFQSPLCGGGSAVSITKSTVSSSQRHCPPAKRARRNLEIQIRSLQNRAPWLCMFLCLCIAA